MTRPSVWSVAVLGALVATAAPAQDVAPTQTDEPALSYSFAGQYVNLPSRSSSLTAGPFFSDLQRGRLDFTASLRERLVLKLVPDVEATLGDVLETPEFVVSKEEPPRGQVLVDADDLFVRFRLYRAHLTLNAGPVRLTAGRQRIALGVARLWSPVDTLNPLDPFSIEKEERVGVDAAYGEWQVDAPSQLSLAFVPERHGRESVAFARYLRTLAGTDVSLSAMRRPRARDYGVTVERSIGGAGLRAEAVYRDPTDAAGFGRASVGADYTFASSLGVGLEYYYNGRRPSAPVVVPPIDTENPPTLPLVLRVDHLDLARHNLGLTLSYEVTPDLRANALLIQTLHDASLFVNPWLVYSVTKSVDVSGGALFFPGLPDGPLGRAPNAYFLRLEVFF